MNERALSVVLTLLLVVSSLSAGVGSVAADTGSETTFHVVQGSECYEISPYGDGNTRVEKFYDYRSNETNETGWWTNKTGKWSSYGTTHLQENQNSSLFVYDGEKGYSLVLLHDKFSDGPHASTITFEFSKMPSSGEWVVRDDNYNNDTQDDNWETSDSDHIIDWMWAEDRNDGGAFLGIGDAEIKLNPRFNEDAREWESWPYTGPENRTENWNLLDGDGTRQTLDMKTEITLARGGCPDETSPNAALSVIPQTVQTGESVSFNASESSDNETSIAQYRWDFDGDGQIDRNTSSATTTYTYDTADNYDASVTVVDEGDNTDSVTKTVTVEEADSSGPTVTVDAPETVNVSEQFNLSASASDAENVSSYEWNFSGTTKPGQEVSHSYDSAGTYDVTVNVTYDNGTSVEESVTIEAVDDSPVAAFSVSSDSVANNEPVEFDASDSSDDQGIVSFDWEFGDGDTASGETVNHTYNSAGDYNVTLTVTDADGNTDTANETVTVTEPDTIEYINESAVRIHGDFETVSVDSTFFAKDGVGTSNYDLGPVNGTTVVHARDEGTWGPVISTVTVHEGGIGSPANASKDNPDFAAQLSEVRPERPSTFVDNATKVDNETYQITFGYVNPNEHAMLAGGSEFTAGNASGAPPMEFEPGRHTFTVNWTPASDDSNLVWETDFSNFAYRASTTKSPTPDQIEDGDMPPTASLAAAPTTVEAGETVAFTAGQSRDDDEVTEYHWDFDGDGETERTTQRSNVTHSYSDPGTYHATVTVVDTSGQTATDQTTVTVEKASTDPPADTGPNAALAADDTFAFGSLAKLVASGSTGDGELTYQWDLNTAADGYERDTGTQPYLGVETWNVYPDEGTYEVSVTVTDADGDTDTATKTVEIVDIQGPTAKLVAPDTVSVGEEFTVKADGAGDPSGLNYITWKFDGEDRKSGKTVSHVFNETGDKTVTLLMRDLEGHNTRMETTVHVDPADNSNDGDDAKDGDDSKKGINDGDDNDNTGGYVPVNPGGNDNSNDGSSDDGSQSDDSKATAPLTDADGEVGSVVVSADSSDAAVEVSATAPEGVTAPTVEADGFAALSYLNVSGAEQTTFTISKDRLGEASAAPDAVGLFRYEDGAWSAVETAQVEETDDAYEFRANVSDGTFAVGIGKAVTSVTDLSVQSGSIEAGESVTVTATVRNTGHADGTHEVELTVGGEVVATKTVSVAARETVDVTFTHALDESGVYEVGVGDAKAELVVEGVDTTTTAESSSVETSTTTPDNSSGVPGFGIGVALVALMAAALAALRRR